ncbi:EamA family transporter [Nannocystis sp.]|uniref:EamA family transporter n=1 Tax=Nannocystis sp. TaxID=1962667 RepID=UPI0024290593|nr:EamA family transporter [Nannocystis sp.]MBK7827490.1 EamA family transporter [Nannocystis sp.]MBK9756371.1 EamA family transporter [Nannocystis sp.]
MIYLQLVVAILFNVGGQLLFKRASMVSGPDGHAVVTAMRPFFSPWFICGAACIALSAAFWIGVLKKLPLTIAHPITGAGFILVPVASHFIWGEALPPLRVLGILVIVLGIFLVARGAAP